MNNYFFNPNPRGSDYSHHDKFRNIPFKSSRIEDEFSLKDAAVLVMLAVCFVIALLLGGAL